MAKCKCIKNFKVSSNGKIFEVNQYFDFDFIGSIGDKPSFYRVYYKDGSFDKLEVKDFKEHFKRY